MDDEDKDSDCDKEKVENGVKVLAVRQPADYYEGQLEVLALDDAAITVEDACTKAAVFIDGKQVHKSTAL